MLRIGNFLVLVKGLYFREFLGFRLVSFFWVSGIIKGIFASERGV